MIVEQALTIAGPGSVLAARPTGVAHVYTGPLTPSARFIPRAARVVCRARTKRLRVVTTPECWSSLTLKGGVPRLCARCSACLARHRGLPASVSSPAGQAEQLPRDHYRQTYADLTPADLLVAAQCAVTPAEVDHVAHLSLVLFGHRVCTQPTALPSGRTTTPVHTVIARRRLETPHDDIAYRAANAEAHSEAAKQRRIERANEIKAARERERAIPRHTDRTGAPL